MGGSGMCGRLLALVLALPLVVAFPHPPSAGGEPARAAVPVVARPAVILVHGYSDALGDCPGRDVASFWERTRTEIATRLGMAEALVLPVSFYACDTHGVDITGSRRGTDFPLTPTTGTTRPRVAYTTDTSIVRLARDLAWFIHNQFTRRGETVDVLGHSMGGLVIREALRRVQAGARGFPRSAAVRRVLTISTPHLGREYACARNTQCEQMSPSSAFIDRLQRNAAPQGAGGTRWFAMGTRGVLVGNVPCDGITDRSATAVAGVSLIYTKPCYRHKTYLYDDSDARDAEGARRLRGRHSLAMAAAVLR